MEPEYKERYMFPESAGTAERRRENRTLISAEPNVFDRHTRESLGRLVNLSREGFLVVAHEPMMPPAVHEVRIVVVDDYGQLRTINATAELIWCRRSRFDESYGAGFQFSGLDPADEIIVQHLIQAL
ncbi:PilZ domain-containing protein [Ectothiorhodospiraceae bacterium WFHF3C12]|nr:PilZ domain-containing protein [Ectothiorhodospiraceae bacterium WFHF3C12]